MIRIYFEALMVTIKIEKKNGLYIFFFYCLNFIFFILNVSEIYLCWVSCFYFCKITAFIIANAPLILKIFNRKTDIYFFLIHKLLFFLLCAFIYSFMVGFFNYICLFKFLLLTYFCHCHSNHEW